MRLDESREATQFDEVCVARAMRFNRSARCAGMVPPRRISPASVASDAARISSAPARCRVSTRQNPCDRKHPSPDTRNSGRGSSRTDRSDRRPSAVMMFGRVQNLIERGGAIAPCRTSLPRPVRRRQIDGFRPTPVRGLFWPVGPESMPQRRSSEPGWPPLRIATTRG